MPFELILDRKRCLLRIKLRGFWDDATMSAYEREYRAAFIELDSLRPRQTYCIVDCSEYPVQSQEISRGHDELVAWLGPREADRAALIVSNALVRMQASRGLSDRMAVFLSEAEAMEWLACGTASGGAQSSAA
jgi:hypothetical protein